jgi:ribonucleoside-diphosphate reductase alpha chain
MNRATVGLMTGAGIGVVYSALREEGALIVKTGGTSTGPLALMKMINEAGRYIMQGGSRRSAIWAGLHWWHKDIFKFITMKNWSDDVRALKEKDFNFPATMDMTNISVILDDGFFEALDNPNNPMHDHAQKVYWQTVEQMLVTGEPGFSIDVGENAGENLRNACTEITSADDNDICNLGSINLSRVETKEEFGRLSYVGTMFLLCGTLYSKVPYEKVEDTRTKNRRLGLGLMGIYEWLLVRGYRYGPNDELGEWLETWVEQSDLAARIGSRMLNITEPKKKRALAPNGTIGIIGETTTSLEPLLAAAIKRRYLKGQTWHFQYVIDAAAKRLLDKGVSPELLEDAYDLAKDPERRIAFQAWFQQYVDHGISSTLNLPSREQQNFTIEEFGNTLLRYLPKLRGITVYPDGSRGGQPITKVDLQEALDWEGREYEETGNSQSCVNGACGV